jgi:anti-sigma regulatory factor (Ser/Thr protein kinase)
MKFYCTTDGYLDQNGGEKDFPFGKKRFSNIIKEYHQETMADQQTIFFNTMMEYESMVEDNDRNDDMTLIGFEIGSKSEYKEQQVEEIVKYEGVMTQNVIASCMDNIESKIQNMRLMPIVSTITVEYCQNIMNYSKSDKLPSGAIEVQFIDDEHYIIIAKNLISIADKQKIEPKLQEVSSLDKAGIKKRYKELRKSGENTHEKGGGIGIYEIAKVSDKVEYEFEVADENRYYYTMKSFVNITKKES